MSGLEITAAILGIAGGCGFLYWISMRGIKHYRKKKREEKEIADRLERIIKRLRGNQQ